VAHTAEIFASSILVVGDFNPAIFSPEWLERNDLIGSDDANSVRDGDERKSLVISHQVAAFETKWFSLQVLENQFTLTSKDALSPAFKDLAVGIFQLVPHTPVIAAGLNFFGHFKLANEEAYHKVGDVLAPKQIWNTLFPDESAGIADLTMRIQRWKRGEPSVKTKDEKRIAIQPSAKIKFGAFLSYNDHHDLTASEEDGLRPAERVAGIIDSQWESSWKDAVRVFDGLLSMALSA
jgi:hypothetical protein